jgi:hypothetical protein
MVDVCHLGRFSSKIVEAPGWPLSTVARVDESKAEFSAEPVANSSVVDMHPSESWRLSA